MGEIGGKILNRDIERGSNAKCKAWKFRKDLHCAIVHWWQLMGGGRIVGGKVRRWGGGG